MMSTRFRTNIDVIRMVAKLFFSKSLSVNVHEHQSVAPESINAEWSEDIGTMYEDTFTFCGILLFRSFQCREFYKIDFASWWSQIYMFAIMRSRASLPFHEKKQWRLASSYQMHSPRHIKYQNFNCQNETLNFCYSMLDWLDIMKSNNMWVSKQYK